MSRSNHKNYLNNKINIVIENIESEISQQNKNNISDETNNPNDLNKNKPNENVLEKYMQSILKPINIIETLFFCA